MRLFIIVLISISAVGAIIFFSIPTLKEMRRSNAIEMEIENLREEAVRISADNSFLADQVKYLRSDHYKERLAKDKLNLRNPGEQVVIVQPSTRGDDISQNEEENTGEIGSDIVGNISNFQKWWRYFFK
jgi:cell division protein FtsB